jgi:hypothetical protein
VLCLVVTVVHILDSQTEVNKGYLANELTVRYATKNYVNIYLVSHCLIKHIFISIVWFLFNIFPDMTLL